jgi:hypothetical protein
LKRIQEISEPVEARRMEDQNIADPTGMHPYRDAHVYQEGASQPAGPNAAQDLRRGLKAEQQPTGMNTQEPSTLQGAPNVPVVEEKLPFKEQVRAYHKIHRGTVCSFLIIETLNLIWFFYSSSEIMS